MSAPDVGDFAPSLAVQDVDGRVLQLATLWQDGPLLLTFLRHFGCPMCKAFVAQLRQVYPELQALGVEIATVTMGRPDMTQEFCRQQSVPFACLADPERLVYQAYGLIDSFIGATHPTTWVAYARSVLRGNLPRPMPLGTPHGQLSGAFLIDQQGVVRFAHRNQTAADNPSNEQLLAAVHPLAQPVLPRQ